MPDTMFKLKRPCKKCPFRTDVPGYLRRARAAEIARSLADGAIFPCHETTVEVEDDEEGSRVATSESQFCAGALICIEHQEVSNQATRMAERLGLYDASGLDLAAPVHKSFVDFVAHHGEDEFATDDDDECEETVCSVVEMGCQAPAGYMINGMVIPPDDEDTGPVHPCPDCGNAVCEACSDDEGRCSYCVEYAESEASR